MKNGLIVWAEVNGIGVPIIDEQHRGIVTMINTLFFFMRNNRAGAILLPTVSMLEEFARIHFLTEEALLQKARYPDFERHQRLHMKFMERTFQIGLAAKKTGDPADLLEFLKTWWVGHINNQDRLYIEHLKSALNNFDNI